MNETEGTTSAATAPTKAATMPKRVRKTASKAVPQRNSPGRWQNPFNGAWIDKFSEHP